MSKLTVDTEEIVRLTQNSGTLVFTKEAETSLRKLLDLQKQVNDAVEEVKTQILESGNSLMPGFSGVVGSALRVSIVSRGMKYAVADEKLALPFLKESKRYFVKSTEVGEFEKKNGRLPDGIALNPRTQSVEIKYAETTNEL